MGTYEIKSIVDSTLKFCCMVSFNGKPEEYYEIESFEKDEIDRVLQKVADDDKIANSIEEKSFEIANGKIV